MSGATNKITALYCRLSQEDAPRACPSHCPGSKFLSVPRSLVNEARMAAEQLAAEGILLMVLSCPQETDMI